MEEFNLVFIMCEIMGHRTFKFISSEHAGMCILSLPLPPYFHPSLPHSLSLFDVCWSLLIHISNYLLFQVFKSCVKAYE